MLQFWQKIIHIKKESKQCALMEIWKHQHCQIKSCICYHHYFHCIAFVWRTNCQICGLADLSPQVIVHNAQCTIAHVHLRGGGLSIYRWERNSATEQLRLVSVQQCGAFEIGVQQCSLWRHLSYISRQVQSVHDAQLCLIVAIANFHWYQQLMP